MGCCRAGWLKEKSKESYKMNNSNKNTVSSGRLAIEIWLYTVIIIDVGLFVAFGTDDISYWGIMAIVVACSLFCALPALGILAIITSWLGELNVTLIEKTVRLHIGIFFIGLLYSLVAFVLGNGGQSNLYEAALVTGVIYAAACIAVFLNRKMIKTFLAINSISNSTIYTSTQNNLNMYENSNGGATDDAPSASPSSNKILIKSIITAVLILAMLIPTAFVQSIIAERQERQQQVVDEVSSKWALPQMVSAPYLVIPYTVGKTDPEKKKLIILPDQLDVQGNVLEESRPRSIYKVLLYKSKINFTGNFHTPIAVPDSANLLFSEVKLCFGLTDFRGIEDKINVELNNSTYNLLPGLPTNTIDDKGLSTRVNITQADIERGITFNMALSLRGSGNLHFIPLGSNSNFHIQSAWPNPSFDGKTLPTERNISGNGFDATWKFSAANLPFASVIDGAKDIDTKDIAFGLSLVQPADQYVKSMRSAKYAILIIGLTFAVFFIFELLQKKPVHPVQYLLVGMALVIFYTLLVSISEIILFEYAYTIAAVATIILISLYAKAHFKTLRSAVIFGLLLSGLYGFIYVLISLEDTALLVGSIALFIVVAIIMYVTRKVNWYQIETPHTVLNVQP